MHLTFTYYARCYFQSSFLSKVLCFIESDLLQAVNVPEPLVKNLFIL